MINKLFYFLAFLLCTHSVLVAQKVKLGDLIALALERNHDIVLARQQVLASDAASGYGNAGMLPFVGFNGGLNQSSNDTRQRFVSGQEVSQKGAESRNLNAGLVLNWTLFDGMRMFAAYRRLETLKEISHEELKSGIERTTANVIELYYMLNRQDELLSAQRAALKVSEERIRIAQENLQVGTGNKLDLLQAQLDKNAQLTAIDNLIQERISIQSNLNILVGRIPTEIILPADTQAIQLNLPFDSLRTLTFMRNTSLRIMEKNIRARELELQENKGSLFPRIDLNAGYGLNRVQNEVGFLLFNNTYSLSVGLSATWTLFNGFQIQKRNQMLNIEKLKQETLFDQSRLQLEGALFIAWEQQQRAKLQFKREGENLLMAQEALAIALERLRVGSSTPLELMVVQQTFAEAAARKAQASFLLTKASTDLMLLDGSLVAAE
jgi:outer membrane protein